LGSHGGEKVAMKMRKPERWKGSKSRVPLYKLTTITLFVLTLVSASKTVAQDKHWLSYDPAVVALEGRLTVEWKYGPPNYGENPKTDAKVRVPVLVLSEPVSVRPNPDYFPFNVEVRGVRRIQLILFNLETPYEQFIGRRVLVNGTLFHAHTGHHYTKVVMEVSSLKLKKNG
jgi:hypothetical protein